MSFFIKKLITLIVQRRTKRGVTVSQNWKNDRLPFWNWVGDATFSFKSSKHTVYRFNQNKSDPFAFLCDNWETELHTLPFQNSFGKAKNVKISIENFSLIQWLYLNFPLCTKSQFFCCSSCLVFWKWICKNKRLLFWKCLERSRNGNLKILLDKLQLRLLQE